tara:strand:+ start:255 stop:578 length:324 start_codon:yes stop_codon:yes gene_type:complete
MDIWVVLTKEEYENFPTTHLTQKGALLEAIDAVLQFLGLTKIQTDPQDWTDFLNGALNEWTPSDVPSVEDWREKDCDGLWKLYDFLAEFTWDYQEFDIEVQRTQVKP